MVESGVNEEERENRPSDQQHQIAHDLPSQVLSNFRGERAHIDWLRDVAVESSRLRSRTVFRHRVRCEGDHLPGAPAYGFQFLQDRVAVAAGELNVEEHQGGWGILGANDVDELIAGRQPDDTMALQRE